MNKLALYLSCFMVTLSAQAAGYEPNLIYRAIKTKAVEQCNGTEECPEKYVQAKTAGGLTCTFTIHNAKGSSVEFDCTLSRSRFSAVYDALNITETGSSERSRKSVGGLVCEVSHSFWGDSKTSCVLRK